MPLIHFPPEFLLGGRLTTERASKIEFGPPGWLKKEEKKLVLHILRMQEKVLAWDETELGCLWEDYAPPY